MVIELNNYPLLSFLKQGFSKIITKSIITNKMEYSKYINIGTLNVHELF